MTDLGLFELPAGAVRIPDPPAEGEKISAGRRLTLRQRHDLDVGRHPLAGGPLHADAAPHDDTSAPGRRCGNCRHRELFRFPKCTFGGMARVTGGPATDVRAWWPGCLDHEWGDPQLSPDAARSGPPS